MFTGSPRKVVATSFVVAAALMALLVDLRQPESAHAQSVGNFTLFMSPKAPHDCGQIGVSTVFRMQSPSAPAGGQGFDVRLERWYFSSAGGWILATANIPADGVAPSLFPATSSPLPFDIQTRATIVADAENCPTSTFFSEGVLSFDSPQQFVYQGFTYKKMEQTVTSHIFAQDTVDVDIVVPNSEIFCSTSRTTACSNDIVTVLSRDVPAQVGVKYLP